MYLPKHQYTKRLVSDLLPSLSLEGINSLIDAAGKVFDKPEVVLTSEGEYYDVPSEDLTKGIFTNAQQLFPSINQQPADPTNAYIQPTDVDKQSCKFKRYFTKNKSTGKIKELTKTDYQQASSSAKNYELFAETDWNLCGPLSDQEINGYFLEGTASKNEKLVNELEKKIPGIKDILTDYGQFVDDKTPPAPAPKTPTKITVPAPSK